MIAVETLDRLETQLTQLAEGMLVQRQSQVDFLIGLNRLDDIFIDLSENRPIIDSLSAFLTEYRHWLETGRLNINQKKRLSLFFNRMIENLLAREDNDHFKLAEELKDWSQKLGTGTFKLTLKSPGEQASLADRFYSLLRREAEEMNILLEERGHLMTCLDDLLFSAESRTDKMYQHLAASLIYFLKLEGYKVDPYVKRLRQLRENI